MNSDIPQSWKKVKLGTLMNLVRKTFKPDKNDVRPYVGLEHIVPGGLRLVSHGWSSEIKSNKFEFRKGDILFGKLRPYFRKVLYAKFDGVCSTDIWVIRPKNGIDGRFLFYRLASWEVVNASSQASNGTKMPRAQWDYLENYEVALPPLPEQRKIAEILGSIDDKIELNYEMNKTLEAIAQAIFKNWFVDFEPFKDELVYNEELGKEIPRGWEVAKIGEVAKIESGGNAPQGEEYFINGVYPFVRVKHLTDSPVVGGSDLINKKAIEDYRLRLFKKGSIIFAKSGEAIKAERINILPFDAFIVNHLAIISKATVSLWFIYFYMRELIHKLVIEQGGTALPYLRISDIEREILLKPPSSVIEVFHSLTDPIFQNILLNYQENRTLEKIRDSLLPKLLSGEIRVKADVEREFPEETKKLEEIGEEKIKLQESLDRWLK